MNKTLIKIGVGIWGLMLFLSFIIGWILAIIGLTSEQIALAVVPFGIIEVIAFILVAYGLLTGSD